MTALGEGPDDVEEALVVYLTGLRRSAITRVTGDVLPFNLVRHIGGDEDPERGFADPLVSVRTLCDKALGETAARDACRLTHEWMINLARNQDDIPISGGRIVNFDFVTVVESPHWVEYDDDQILCKVGRYGIGLSYSRTT